jgi:hypothetical protein
MEVNDRLHLEEETAEQRFLVPGIWALRREIKSHIADAAQAATPPFIGHEVPRCAMARD